MKHRIYFWALCVIFIGNSCTEKVSSKTPYAPSKDDIFIDEPQGDMLVEGIAANRDFSDHDESSGNGPEDDEDMPGSGRNQPDDTEVEESGSGDFSTTEPPSVVRIVTDRPLPTTTTATTKHTDPPQTTRLPPDNNANLIPVVTDPPKTGGKHTTPDEDNDTDNDVGPYMGQRADDRPASFFAQPGILAAVIGGAVVGLLCAILLVMFIVYRMRKKDEGSYPLDEPKRSPTVNSYTRNTNKEFYAWSPIVGSTAVA